MDFKISIVKNEQHIDKTPTEKQPYLLDELVFAVTKEDEVIVLAMEQTEDSKQSDDPWIYKDLASGKIYNTDDFYYKATLFVESSKPLGIIGAYGIKEFVDNLRMPSSFTRKVRRNIERYDAWNFPNGQPRLGYRASEEEIRKLVADIQKGYTIALNKESERTK